MSFRRLLSQTATVTTRTPGTSDAEGNVVTANTSADYPALVQQTDAIEVLVGDVRSVSNWLLFLLPDAAINAQDQVVVDGRTYEVTGEPAVLRTPRGPHHIEARLRIVA